MPAFFALKTLELYLFQDKQSTDRFRAMKRTEHILARIPHAGNFTNKALNRFSLEKNTVRALP
jgi:hypothetical protein